MGRLAGMTKAYKQLAGKPDHTRAFVIAVYDHELDDVVFFISPTLLFGQTGAVYGFNRVAKFIATVLTKGAGLIVPPYYDDFSQLEVAQLAESAERTIKSAFKVLGFKLSEAPAKDKPFAPVFTPLGGGAGSFRGPRGPHKDLGQAFPSASGGEHD